MIKVNVLTYSETRKEDEKYGRTNRVHYRKDNGGNSYAKRPNNTKYHRNIFPRVWTKIKAKYDVANYRELPEIFWNEILEYLRDMSINVQDIVEEERYVQVNWRKEK